MNKPQEHHLAHSEFYDMSEHEVRSKAMAAATTLIARKTGGSETVEGNGVAIKITVGIDGQASGQKHAFIVVRPSVVEARIEGGELLSEPLKPEGRVFCPLNADRAVYAEMLGYGRLLRALIERGVDSIEIRVESVDD